MKPLEGKTVLILVANEFEDIELFYPLIYLSGEGAKVIVGTGAVAGSHPRPWVPEKPITGRFGLPIPVSWLPEGSLYTMKRVADIKIEEIDAIVVPGGFCPDSLRRDPVAVGLVRAAASEGKPVAAICHGPWLLFSAEVVSGRKITSFVSIRDDGVHAGAEWVDAPVVVDGPIITSRTPADLPEFCHAIVDALTGK